MAGNKRAGIVLQERDFQLFRELEVMRVIDREQAKVVAGFGSTTRANARLLALTRSGLLRRFFLGTTAGGAKALYSLSAKGAQLIGSSARALQRRTDEMLVGDLFVGHQLAVNVVYVAFKFDPNLPLGVKFLRWTDFGAPLVPALVPDGYVEMASPSGVLGAFLEIDLGTESGTIWQQKVRKYLHLAVSGEFQKHFAQERFRVLVIAHSERRMESIRKTIAQLTDKIFWFSSLDLIRKRGLFADVWCRSAGDQAQPLIKEIP